MSESMEGPQSPEETGSASSGLVKRGRTWLGGRRRARWLVAGATAVVVAGGGVAAVAVHHEGEGHDRTAAAEDGHEGHGSHKGRDGREAGEGGRGEQSAPAPLPSTDAADAVVKASSGVAGGKVESLRAVSEQGGGRAWQAVVVGPDGVRHLVTVDGANGTITGNAVLGG
ncbi:hypothetical protein ACGF0D_38830 [Kitasatospora sp. NPDC048298]|uniref:hypothetical protein n=1 Tax=Kitasatospora sp. NPDC048298 TaxID=3364049 RepID=UPI003720562B